MEIKKSGRGENRNSFNLTNVHLHCIQKSFNRMPQFKKKKNQEQNRHCFAYYTVGDASYLPLFVIVSYYLLEILSDGNN